MSDNKTDWIASWARMRSWQGTSGLPVLPPVGALLELAVMVALIVIIDWAFPTLGFMTLEPSPFWLPVLLLSLQYGTVAGLLAAAAATAAYVFNGVAEQAVGENFFSYLLRIWALPILWLGVALVLGQFRLRQIAEKQELRQNLTKRTHEAQRLSGYAKDLEARCQTLERHMTTRTAAAVKPVLDALAKVADPAADLQAVLDTIAHSIWPGSQVSVSAVTRDGCQIIARSGWPDQALWPEEIATGHLLYRAIVNERRPVSILFRGDEQVLDGLGIAAHPILTFDTSRVAGMLKIEMIDPRFLDDETAAHLAMIARLLAPAVPETRVVTANAGPRALAGISRLARRWKETPASAPQNGGDAAAVRSSDDAPQRKPLPWRSS